MSPIINISAYKFIKLSNLEVHRLHLKARATELGLRGSILLSTEGINLFLAGPQPSIVEIQQELTATFKITRYKESISEKIPFKRLLVKIKKEIIAMDKIIDADLPPAPYVTPTTLKQWLDEGRNIVLLDTRNDYEVRLGKFNNAIELNLQHFRNFPKAIEEQLDPAAKKATVVTYCTGGIRCEKAALAMQEAGFEDVYQLEDGILGYFEMCGDAHYTGECFVFDQRVSVDPALQESATAQCFACRMPVTPLEQHSPWYQIGVSCPTCKKARRTVNTDPSLAVY